LAASCELGNELLYFTKCGEFYTWLTKIPWPQYGHLNIVVFQTLPSLHKRHTNHIRTFLLEI